MLYNPENSIINLNKDILTTIFGLLKFGLGIY